MEEAQANILPEDASTASSTHSYRLLVVDDNESCAKVIMWGLEALGHTAQMATNGQAAIALAKSFLPDAVLLDIGLPGMNGYEICQAMRKEASLRNTVFIAQTGWSQKEHKERSKEAGFDYHLVKPLDIEALKKILDILSKRAAASR